MTKAHNESGNATTELAVLLALVAAVAIGGISGMSAAISDRLFLGERPLNVNISPGSVADPNDGGLAFEDTTSGSDGFDGDENQMGGERSSQTGGSGV